MEEPSFKRKLVFTFFCFLLFSFQLLAEQESSPEGEPLLQERAVFRLNNRVLYLSEVRPYIEAIQTFRCFSGEKLLLFSTELDSKRTPNIPQLDSELESLNTHKEFLRRLLNLLTATNYASRFSLSLEKEDFNDLFITEDCLSPGVAKNFERWPKELQSLAQSEAYYRQRFLSRKERGKQKVSTTAFSELKKFIQGLSEKYDQGVFFGTSSLKDE